MCPNSRCALHMRRERAASCPLPGQPVCLSVCPASSPFHGSGQGTALCTAPPSPGGCSQVGVPRGERAAGPGTGMLQGPAAGGGRQGGERLREASLGSGSSSAAPKLPKVVAPRAPPGIAAWGRWGEACPPPGAARLRLNNRRKRLVRRRGAGGQRVFLVSSKPAAVVDGKAMKADTMLLLLV